VLSTSSLTATAVQLVGCCMLPLLAVATLSSLLQPP
jgi:hypothetical protein